jgi:hypothetical protein
MAMREAGRFVAELEFGGLLTVLELEFAGAREAILATEDGRPVFRVSDGVFQVGEAGECAYRIEM